MWKRFGSNAFANMLTGVSSIVFQLGLTAMAARSFDAATFSVWTLALSMAGLTPLFAINLSSVVTRQLVPAFADRADRTSALIMGAARQLGRALALLAVVAIMLAALGLHHASPNLASTGTGTFLLVVVLLTFGQLWQIGLQPVFGWYYAHEQNWPVAAALLVVRVGALVAMWLATRMLVGDLLAASVSLALGHWAGVGLARLRFFSPQVGTVKAGAELKRQVLETAHLLRWFAIWSVGMAAIQYGLPPLMSVLGTPDYNAFYLAYSLNLVLSGVVGAIGSAMLAPLARLGANGDGRALVQALVFLPMLIALILLSVLVGLRLSMPLLVTHWSHGIALPGDVNGYLFLLGFQTIARSLSVVFGIVLASRATAWRLVGPTLLELVVTLLVAVPLGSVFGDRVFLLALAGAGGAAGLALAVVGSHVGGLERRDRRRVVGVFVATECVALTAWWLVAG